MTTPIRRELSAIQRIALAGEAGDIEAAGAFNEIAQRLGYLTSTNLASVARDVPGPAAEAIANADAHLNNAALPTYSALAEQHADLLAALRDARERMLGSSPAIRALIVKTDAAIAKATGGAA